MTSLSAAQIDAREHARVHGRFGTQPHADAGIVAVARADRDRDAVAARRVADELNAADAAGGAWDEVISRLRLDDAATEAVGGWGGDAFVTEDQELFSRDEPDFEWSHVGPFGPPVEDVAPTGERYFTLNGRLHNVDGPAVIHPNGRVEFWVNGKPSTAPTGAPVAGAGYLPDDLTPPF